MAKKSKRTKEEMLKIGKEIYDHKINNYEASIKYNINFYTARDYYRMYKASLSVDQNAQIK